MPGFAHLVTGIVFSVLLYNCNPKRFTRKHAVIFAFMSYLGPDIAHILSFGWNELRHFGHSILGWPIYALLFLPLYTFLTRFSFDAKSLQLHDEGPVNPSQLRWWQVYLLMVGGGLFHFSVDITLETKRIWPYPMNDPWKLSIESLKESLYFTTDYSDEMIMLVSLVLILIMFLLFNEMMKRSDESKNPKWLNITITIFVIIFIVFYSIVGTYGEGELGAITYFVVFFFGPIIFALFSFSPEERVPSPNEYNSEKGKVKLNIGIIYFAIIGIGISAFGIFASSSPLKVLELIPNKGVQDIIEMFYEVLNVLIYILALLHLTVAYLLFKRNNQGQKIARFLLALFFLFMIPLAIWGLLREEEVVSMFNND